MRVSLRVICNPLLRLGSLLVINSLIFILNFVSLVYKKSFLQYGERICATAVHRSRQTFEIKVRRHRCEKLTEII